MCTPEYSVQLIISVFDLDASRAKNVKMVIPPVIGMTLFLSFPGSEFEKEFCYLETKVKDLAWDEKHNQIIAELEQTKPGLPLLIEAIVADPNWYDPYASAEE